MASGRIDDTPPWPQLLPARRGPIVVITPADAAVDRERTGELLDSGGVGASSWSALMRPREDRVCGGARGS
jgi:hypothetical protein